jgi:uncharacterized protein YpmS
VLLLYKRYYSAIENTAFYLDRYCYICKMELSTEERNSLIKDYFTKGLTQKEIWNILMCRNHIVSLVHLKRLGPVVQLVVKFQPMVKNENL